MGRPREFDEDEALFAALETFWELGYGTSSVADLAEHMGLQKGSLYGAFGDKHRLYLTALNRYQEEGLARIKRELAAEESPRASLRRFFATVVDRASRRDGQRGCLCVNTAVELAPHDEQVARILKRHFDRVERLFADVLKRGQERCEFSPELEPRAGGRFLLTLLSGLAVLAKTRPGRARLADAVRVGLAGLDP